MSMMESVSYAIRRLILLLVHIVFHAYIRIQQTIHNIRKTILYRIQLLFSYGLLAALFPSTSLPGLTLQKASTSSQPHPHLAQHLRYTYNKLPKHLAIAISSSQITKTYIAHLITWIMETGITGITIYDADGKVQQICCEIAQILYHIQKKMTNIETNSIVPHATIVMHTHISPSTETSTSTSTSTSLVPASASASPSPSPSPSTSSLDIPTPSSYLIGYQHGYTHGYWNGLTTAIIHGMSDKGIRQRKHMIHDITTTSLSPQHPHTIRITSTGVSSLSHESIPASCHHTLPPIHTTSTSQINIHLLSHINGQQAICEAVQCLAMQKDEEHIKTGAALRKHLHHTSGTYIPEPDLLLVIGSSSCTVLNFPSWLLRCAEIINIDQLSNMNIHTLRNALCQFSKTTQRWGR